MTSANTPRAERLPRSLLFVVACTLAVLAGPGAASAQFVEVDNFELSRGIFHVTGPTGNMFVLDLGGPTTVHVTFELLEGEALDDDMDGQDEVQTELVSLEMDGPSSFGPVVVRLDTRPSAPPALGEIEETTNTTPGTLDLPPFTVGGTADSFFDVSFEAEIGGLTLRTQTPIRIQAVISEKPPAAGEIYVGTGPIPLLLGPIPSGVILDRVELELNPILRDMGDAPDPLYPTLMASDGARHDGDGTLRLGALWDREFEGQPTVAADGDGDDEDGVVFTSGLTLDLLPTMTTLDVTASASGKLDAWLDLNGDGDWTDPGEQVFAGVSVVAGSNALAFAVPTDASLGCTYARFRLSSDGGLSFDGLAADGEVEDYRVEIVPVDHLDLFNLNLTVDQTFFAAISITAGGDFTITPDLSILAPANVVFHAGDTVLLKNGLLVEQGASLTIITGPVPGGCPP